MYYNGHGVEKDLENGIHHWEEAAIGGQPQARHYLAIIEGNNGNTERTVKHLIIAAKLGHDRSLKTVKRGCMIGLVSKED